MRCACGKPLLSRGVKEERRGRVVALDAAAVRVHPRQVVLRLGVAEPGRLAVVGGGANRVLFHTFAVFVSERLLTQYAAQLAVHRPVAPAGWRGERGQGGWRRAAMAAHHAARGHGAADGRWLGSCGSDPGGHGMRAIFRQA